ncbi:MAG: histidine kinase N-terminal 7TM domain-containing protein [Tenuifilaceae bacterium]|jgi:PAS domain S-box-containing protein|nr:histidine kinase N-terminal 7TM domain-containing protein [Tenuifilaceae bacterium]
MNVSALITILLLAGVLSAILTVYVLLKRKSLEAPSLAWLLLSVSVWCFAAAVELQLTNVAEQKVFNVIRYLGIVSVPVWLLYFALEYSQRLCKVKRWMTWPVWIIPALSILLLATNRYHHLFYARGVEDIADSFLSYRSHNGIWWWVHTLYSYALFLTAIAVLVRLLLQSSKHQRGTVWLVLVSSAIPFLANILYAGGFTPFTNIDITPLTFAFSGGLFFWGLYSKNFFTVKPIALNTLFNNLPDGIIVTDVKGIVVDINHSAIDILGLKESNPLTQSVHNVLPYRVSLSNANALNKLHLVKHNDRYVEAVHSIIKNEYGQSVGYLVVLKDVTAKRLSETKLKAATDRLELASQAAGLDAWENNLVTGSRVGGVKVYMELGYQEDEVPKDMDGIYKMIHPDDLPSVMKSLEEHFEGITPVYSKDFRIRDKKGNYQWVANFARVVERDEQGKPLRFIGITQNINHRKRAEDKILRQNEELIKVNAEKDKFFSIIAHDLKGPFQGFIGLTELMSGSIDEMDKDELQSIIRTLNITAKNLYELLDNLLNWAVVKRGHKKFDPQKLHLALLFDDVREIVDYMADQKGILLTSSIPTGLNVLADKESLRTIFRNLVSNAIKFTPSGGSVTLKAYANDKGYVVVSVADTGIGMPDQIKKNLFSISTKVSRPGTNNEPSTGLGLILCKELVEKHGGTIWVESHEGQGSTIYFTVPAAN